MKNLNLVVPFLIASFAQIAGVSMAQAQDLPDGKGKDVVTEVCTACHGTDLIVAQRDTKAGWALTIGEMVDRGAVATKEQIQTINDYLATHLGKVDLNKAASAEIAGILEITSAQADAIVKYRTANGAFKSYDDLKKVPGMESANLEAKQDRMVY